VRRIFFEPKNFSQEAASRQEFRFREKVRWLPTDDPFSPPGEKRRLHRVSHVKQLSSDKATRTVTAVGQERNVEKWSERERGGQTLVNFTNSVKQRSGPLLPFTLALTLTRSPGFHDPAENARDNGETRETRFSRFVRYLITY